MKSNLSQWGVELANTMHDYSLLVCITQDILLSIVQFINLLYTQQKCWLFSIHCRLVEHLFFSNKYIFFYWKHNPENMFRIGGL